MAATTSVTIRMDAELKRQSELLFKEFGMNMTTALTVFCKAVVREGRIPFEIGGGSPTAPAPKAPALAPAPAQKAAPQPADIPTPNPAPSAQPSVVSPVRWQELEDERTDDEAKGSWVLEVQ